MEGSLTSQTSASLLDWTGTMWGQISAAVINSLIDTQPNTDAPTLVLILISCLIPEITALACFSQYVSALRPPKKKHQRSTGTSIDSDVDEDSWSNNRFSQRRTSLTFPKPLGARDSFQNRSLQDFSVRIKLTVGEELELQRRKQSILKFSRSEEDMTPTASSESFSSDNSKEEWKQVMNKFWAVMFAQILWNRFLCHFICLLKSPLIPHCLCFKICFSQLS